MRGCTIAWQQITNQFYDIVGKGVRAQVTVTSKGARRMGVGPGRATQTQVNSTGMQGL